MAIVVANFCLLSAFYRVRTRVIFFSLARERVALAISDDRNQTADRCADGHFDGCDAFMLTG